MAYDFSTMTTEVYNRGFQYLNDSGAGTARVQRWLNDANHEIDDLERWPYRMASQTGTSPITVTDLGEVEAVYDPAAMQTLTPTDRGTIIKHTGDLAQVDVARVYYMTSPTVIAVYPVSTVTFTVTYWKTGPDLSGSTDTPLMPDRWRTSIVERACAKAYRDTDDQDMAVACQTESDRLVDRMREYYLLAVGSSRVAYYGYSEDS